ncbi:DUF721 domain-containing protein [Myxococcota bacterium]|nr:DUF721 domain-containing protein [Myxococcota bacterium]MBU1536923.1 DUF721 domain-containing protein [Myxococcota bacterium]
MTRKFFTTIDETLGSFFSGSEELRELWQLVRIRNAWEQLPEIIQKNSSPIQFSEGILICTASSTVWVQELTLKKPQLKAHIGSVFPESVPREIRFRLTERQPKRVRPEAEPQDQPLLRPRIGSPAWLTLKEIREHAQELDLPWSQWFLRVTEPFFQDGPPHKSTETH